MASTTSSAWPNSQQCSKFLGESNSLFASTKETQVFILLTHSLLLLSYGMIEEIDDWVGHLLNKLEQQNLVENTIVVFTSDHGEMMGAHGMRNKFNFLEESVRIPMIMSYPNGMPSGSVVKQPVSQIDLHSTILDYTGGSNFDTSDGQSLRRFIENTSFNQFYDETAVVAEIDDRWPKGPFQLAGELGGIPNFMIRKDNWKLILPKKRNSKVVDMFYNLNADPYETNNLLGSKGPRASDAIVGKVEHLKILLLESLKRLNGPEKLYSSAKYNLGEGRGDIIEIKRRRTWKRVNYWESDRILKIGKATFDGKVWKRREYMYIGRTKPGMLTVRDISVRGLGKYSEDTGLSAIFVSFHSLRFECCSQL